MKVIPRKVKVMPIEVKVIPIKVKVMPRKVKVMPQKPEVLGAVQLNRVIPAARVHLKVTIGKHGPLFEFHIELATRALNLDAEYAFDVELGIGVAIVVVRTILAHAEAQRFWIDLLLKG